MRDHIKSVVVLTVIAMLGALPLSSSAATWYIRSDGGDTLQCTGQSDAPYPGAGASQPCAFNHPFWLLKPNGSGAVSGAALLNGGDTAIIGPGEYMMGIGAPNSSACNASWAYGCTLPPIPSGPDAAHPTRIYGRGWDNKATPPPQLWGFGRAAQVLSLKGSSNVEIRHLEITDHSACIYNSPDPAKACDRGAPYNKPFADVGIYAVDSKNVLLKDLNIHGISKTGLWAGRLRDWTLDGVTIRASGFTGWDGDVGSGLIGSGTDSSNSGAITIRKSKILYTGCGEKYPTTELWGCHGQSQSGQGDGFGTTDTEGTWIIEDSEFSHNLQDGFDLLYHTGTNGTVTFNRVRAEGNAGNGLKVSGQPTILNSVIIGNCDYFVNNPIAETYSGAVEVCRAGGTPLMTAGWRPNATGVIVNSLITGTSTVLIEAKSGNSIGKTVETTGSALNVTANNKYATNRDLDKVWIRQGGAAPEGLNLNGMTIVAVPVAGGAHYPIRGTWTHVGNGVWELTGFLSQTNNQSSFAYLYIGHTCDGSERFISRNNVIIGMESWYKKTHGEPGVKSDFYYLDGYDGNGSGPCGAGPARVVLDNKDSIVYNVKYSPCPNSNNILCLDPLLTSIPPLVSAADMYTYGERWNVMPKPTSPAVSKPSTLPGVPVAEYVAVPDKDIRRALRPANSITWGPLEFNAPAPAPEPTTARGQQVTGP